jgi:NADPH2:quinone reductase
MRAALIHRCGEAPSVGSRPEPVPPPGTVLVRVTAASITPLDLLCASGSSYFGEPATPYVPGVQGVGELADGTAVWFATPAGMRPGDGSMAEYAVVGAADVVALPDGVDHRLVAALGLSAVAALMALTWRGGLQPGEKVLVLGGGGVVGQVAIQLAKLGGAGRVVALCRSAEAGERALQVGADAVVASSAPPQAGADGGAGVGDLTAAITEVMGGPVDLVLDPVFGLPAAAALRALRPHGRLVNLGSAAGETAPIDSATLRSNSLDILGYTNNDLTTEQRAAAIEVIAEHVRTGTLTLDHEVVGLHEIGEAWTRQTKGQAARRIVLVP